ncbi:hypothetical protein [Ferrovum myxofaciens]|uniref:hypothetical protein n=1 Tax=Ferrovum myxofaciens TaxID=416213 RepID=UPI003EBC89B5
MLDEAPKLNEDPVQAKTTAAKHLIRASEDALFEKWVEARPKRNPFASDGCADPEMFVQSRYRIVFVLKERNWGYTVDEQREFAATQDDLPKRLTELHEDLGRETFDVWWTLMAQWAEMLLATDSVDWPTIEKRFDQNAVPDGSAPWPMTTEEKEVWIHNKNKEALGKCACVQLKKAPGGGTMNKADFREIVEEDRDFILRQFAIYSPHFIVSCGSGDNWNMFLNALFKVDPKSEVKRTHNGIQYFLASSLDHGLCKTAVVNFGHPSMRVNNSLWGVLAFGLREALDEIMSSCQGLGVPTGYQSDAPT